MSTYQPQEGVFAGRPPCANCFANFQLHRPPAELVEDGFVITGQGLGKLHQRGVPLTCPEAYRPGSLEEAQRGLEAAERSGDQARVFVARGELQRLAGRAPTPGHSVECQARSSSGLGGCWCHLPGVRK